MRMTIALPLASVFFGLALIFVKLSSQRAHPVLANLFLLLTALALQLIVIAFLKWKGTAFTVTSAGVYYAMLAGLCVGSYSICLFLTFAKVDIAKATPIIYIGAICLAILFGVLFLRESFSWLKVAGLALSGVGIFLLYR